MHNGQMQVCVISKLLRDFASVREDNPREKAQAQNCYKHGRQGAGRLSYKTIMYWPLKNYNTTRIFIYFIFLYLVDSNRFTIYLVSRVALYMYMHLETSF